MKKVINKDIKNEQILINTSFGTFSGKIHTSDNFDDEDSEINTMFYGGDKLFFNIEKINRNLKLKLKN